LDHLTDFSPPVLSKQEASERTAQFHELYYYARLWETTRWLGVPTYKCPLDMWVYQEILSETRPEVVVECGTAFGGSALFMATVMDQIGVGQVVTVDITAQPNLPRHPRIEYLSGSTADARTLDQVRSRIRPGARTMVILDSLHTRDHVLAELELFWPLVTPGCYLVVEDTNINGHPVQTDFEPDRGPGAYEAVEIFLRQDRPFERDPSRERLLLTFNPGGYLRRV